MYLHNKRGNEMKKGASRGDRERGEDRRNERYRITNSAKESRQVSRVRAVKTAV